MDIAIKMTLVASLIMMGYNISEFIASYATVCEKTQEFKKMAAETDSHENMVRRSNFILSLLLSLVFVGLTYFSGLALWIIAFVAAKLVFTLYCSDLLLVHVLRVGDVSKKFYMLTKVDALFNALLGLGIALIVVL